MQPVLKSGPTLEPSADAPESVCVVYAIGADSGVAPEVEVTIRRNLAALVDGPDELEVKLVNASDTVRSAGLQTGHLRAIPIKEARSLLQNTMVEMLAQQAVDAVPNWFRGDRDYAALARAMVRLQTVVNHPAAQIARLKEGSGLSRSDRDRWSARVRRAAENGLLAQLGSGEWVLTGKADRLLSDEESHGGKS